MTLKWMMIPIRLRLQNIRSGFPVVRKKTLLDHTQLTKLLPTNWLHRLLKMSTILDSSFSGVCICIQRMFYHHRPDIQVISLQHRLYYNPILHLPHCPHNKSLSCKKKCIYKFWSWINVNFIWWQKKHKFGLEITCGKQVLRRIWMW